MTASASLLARRFLSAATVACTLGTTLAAAPADDPTTPVTVTPTLLPIEASIDSVTLYQGRAAVTRSASSTFKPGVYTIRFTNLPPSVLPDALQGTVGAPAKLLDVNYEEVASPVDVDHDPAVEALRKELKGYRQTLAQFKAKRENLAASIKLLDALATRTVDQTVKGLGSETLDASKFAEQVDAIGRKRDAITTQILAIDEEIVVMADRIDATEQRLDAVSEGTRVERAGSMTIAVPTEIASPVDIHFTYLVGNATWRPNYSVRAANDLSGLQIDYDAAITQRTGESWNDVRLTLSTAQPAHAAAPPSIDPVYVDIVEPMREGMVTDRAVAPAEPVPSRAASGGVGGGGGGNIFGDEGSDAAEAAKEAEVIQNATAATFSLPRTVTLASDSTREQTTRISTIDLKPNYTYVARPLADLAAYLRGTVKNDSKFQLLRGQARVFLGGDSVGVTTLEDVAPDGEFELWFGADKRIQLERKLIARNTSTSGLISKDSDLEWQWRITVKNGIETPTAIEIWDRMPVSRNEEIEVELTSVNPALANDRKYEANERKQGLLKWALTLQPKTADRGPSSLAINWTVKLSRPEKTMITPLPE